MISSVHGSKESLDGGQFHGANHLIRVRPNTPQKLNASKQTLVRTRPDASAFAWQGRTFCGAAGRFGPVARDTQVGVESLASEDAEHRDPRFRNLIRAPHNDSARTGQAVSYRVLRVLAFGPSLGAVALERSAEEHLVHGGDRSEDGLIDEVHLVCGGHEDNEQQGQEHDLHGRLSTFRSRHQCVTRRPLRTPTSSANHL
jgi:hypothetical protein